MTYSYSFIFQRQIPFTLSQVAGYTLQDQLMTLSDAYICHCGINSREFLDLSDDVSFSWILCKVDPGKQLCIFLDFHLSYSLLGHSNPFLRHLCICVWCVSFAHLHDFNQYSLHFIGRA